VKTTEIIYSVSLDALYRCSEIHNWLSICNTTLWSIQNV